jgi:hypothetical protein
VFPGLDIDQHSGKVDPENPGSFNTRLSRSLYQPRRYERGDAGKLEVPVREPARALAKSKGKQVAMRDASSFKFLSYPEAPSTPSPISPARERERKHEQNYLQFTVADLFRVIFITIYFIISFSLLGLTLYLLLSQLDSTPPLLIYTLASTCFSIIIFPAIILSKHRGLILFFGITVLLLLVTSCLAIAFAMTPASSCSNWDYVLSHALTGGSMVRCQLIQIQCAFLWIGI